MAEELIYQSSHEGQEIDDAVDNLGTPQDTADKNTAFGRIAKLREDVGEATDEASADGSLYARQKQDAADIASLKKDLTLTDAIKSLGATPNDDGTWAYKDYNDLSETEIISMYNNRTFGGALYGSYANLKSRCCFSISDGTWKSGGAKTPGLTFWSNSYIETVYDYPNPGESFDRVFYGCGKLKRIVGTLNFNYTSKKNMDGSFDGCAKLEEVSIMGLYFNVSFAQSPNLSKDSILYMVQNSAATTSITITLHPTAYAMAVADTDIQAALQEKTNVSLAQAEETA